MRLLGAAFVVLSSILVGCADPAAAAPRSDELVLEVGGSHPSLREALVAAGRAVSPSHDGQAGPPGPLGEVPPGPEPDPVPDPQPAPGPDLEPAPADHIVVRLERGETLIHLAKKHLGNGNRFREILAANGWSEREARRLPEGQPVKIPLDRGGAPR